MRNDLLLSNGQSAIEARPLGSKIIKLKIFRKNEKEGKSFVPLSPETDFEVDTEWKLEGSPQSFTVMKERENLGLFEGVRFDLPNWIKEQKREGDWTSVSHVVGEETKVYGLGEKTGNLEKSGRSFEMWNTDPGGSYKHNEDPLYSSFPFYLAADSIDTDRPSFLGVYVNHAEPTWFDVKYRGGRDRIGIVTKENYLEFFLISGETSKEVVKRYTELTGKPCMLPKWALGYHHSKWGSWGEENFLQLAEMFREKEIPCDALYLDIQYMNGFKVFTWDEDRFPSPETMLEKLHEMDFKVVNIVDPGIKREENYEPYDSGSNRDIFVKDEGGEDFVGALWPGSCVFPDFLMERTREWWSEHNEKLLELGVNGIWNDMNEPAIFFGEKQIQNLISRTQGMIESGDYESLELVSELEKFRKEVPEGLFHRDEDGNMIPHEKVHNLYALYEAMATEKAFEKEYPDRRPFILTRAGFPGIQKMALKWTGDNSSTWDHMAMSIPVILNLGLSGVPFTGADVGGFDGDVDPELLTRWLQLGAVLPYYRNHSAIGTVNQEPWSFGEKLERINRKYIRLRYRLLPYLYTLHFFSHRDGVPIARPLFMEFESDEDCYHIQDEFMLGGALLVAPVLSSGRDKRHVYLPYEGDGEPIEWKDWWSGDKYESGHRVLDAPLDTIPMFIREDRGVPVTESRDSTEEEPKTLYLKYNLENEVRIPVYHDDGKTIAFEDGGYFLGEFRVRETEDSVESALEVRNEGFEPFWDKVTLKED